MKIAIDIGHNAPPADTGARGIGFEDELTYEVGNKLIDLLERAGHSIVRCCPDKALNLNNSLSARCNTANNANADIFVSIHFNAFNKKAHGTEVFVYKMTGDIFDKAKKVVNEIASLGFFNRGVKSANFAVLKKTDMPAMLIECCFVDSGRDMDLLDCNKIAEAIVKGLLGKEATKGASKPLVVAPPLLATMEVHGVTYLKPTTEQSQNFADKSVLKVINPGKYQVQVLAREEGHHQIVLDDKTWFIFSEHCEFTYS